MDLLQTFTASGFNDALIQKQNLSKDYLNTAWSFNVLRALFLVTAMYLMAPHVAIFFHKPDARLIIQAMTLSFLFQGFTNIGIIYFQKELEFYKYFIHQFSGILTDVIVAITIALLYQSVWALVLGKLAGEMVRLIVSYILFPFMPRFHFTAKKARDLWRYGKWILGLRIQLFFMIKSVDLFVGKLLGSMNLGLYQSAFKLATQPALEINSTASQVTFPAYTKLHDDLPRLKNAVLKVTRVSTFLVFPFTAFVWTLAPDFTRIFLTQKWFGIVRIMQLLSLLGAMNAIFANVGPLLKAVGKHYFEFYWKLFRILLTLAIIYPLISRYEMIGACWAILIPGIAIKAIVIPVLVKIARISPLDLLRSVYASLIGAVLLMGMIWLVRWGILAVFQYEIGIGVFIFLTCLGGGTYLLAVSRIDASVLKDLKHMLSQIKR
jgi:lipopolysaccharide exporter